MKIKKRNNQWQEFNPSKILKRLKDQSKGLSVDFTKVAIDVQQLLYDGITTIEIDIEAARIAASYITIHPDYSLLASRLIISRLHKELRSVSWEVRVKGYVRDELIAKAKSWDIGFNYDSDFKLDYFGANAFMNIYALKNDERQILELPCEMYARVALHLCDNVEDYTNLYEELTGKTSSLATPVLLNAGTNNSSMISCSLNLVKEDSLEGLHDTVGDIIRMSKDSAGIGLNVTPVRSSKTNYSNKGKAGGLVKYAKILNENTRFYRQGESRRGSLAMYLDIWHRDVVDFLNMSNPHGSEETTARDLFPALVIPDLFYKRLQEKANWSLFCPHVALKHLGFPLQDTWGDDFEHYYNMLEQSDVERDVISCEELMLHIVSLQAKSGKPYVFNKDRANMSYNQSNYGICRGSNLCQEIVNYHDANNAGQCALAAVVLPNFVVNKVFDFDALRHSVKTLTFALNRVIDTNKWSTQSAENAGLSQRSIAIGIAGLADCFALMDYAFDSDEAKALNIEIQKTIYYTAVEESCRLNREVYQLGFEHPINQTPLVTKGKFHPEYYGINDVDETLRHDVMNYGVCNSLFVANMPTASTSILLSVNEGFEPFQDLIFTRQTSSGEFTVVNKYLVNDLLSINMWDDDVLNYIIEHSSIQGLSIPQKIKDKYKTIWEIGSKTLIDFAADRQPYVDQSQSMNLYWKEANASKLISSLVYGWSRNLKSGVYYTKIQPQLQGSKSLAVKKINKQQTSNNNGIECFGCSA